jgi:hypothetical protein
MRLPTTCVDRYNAAAESVGGDADRHWAVATDLAALGTFRKRILLLTTTTCMSGLPGISGSEHLQRVKPELCEPLRLDPACNVPAGMRKRAAERLTAP